MPRTPRIQFDGAFYHVYTRAIRRGLLFLDEQDFFYFERFLVEAIERSSVRIYSWCLMPNHLHLLLETPNGDLASFMQGLLTRYAVYFNWRHGLTGHVFERRYQAVLCDKETYFLQLIRYIHLNPYKVKGPTLAKPGAWKWSSHRYYLGLESPVALKPGIAEGLARFGEDPSAARKRYAAFLADGLRGGNWEDFYKPKGNLFLGNESFIESAKKRVQAPVRKEPRRLRPMSSLEQLADEAEGLYGIGRGALASASRERSLCAIRDGFIFVAVRRYRLPAVRVAAFLGRGKSAVSMALRRVAADAQIGACVDRLMAALQY